MRYDVEHRDAAHMAEQYTKVQHFFNQVGVICFLGLSIYLLTIFVGEVDSGNAYWLALALVLGIFLADLLTGLVHWGCDTWGNADTFFWGRGFIRSFREHHVAPSAITDHDWAQANGEQSILGCFFLLLMIYLSPKGEPTGWLFFQGTMFSMLFFAVATNQFHKWSHEKNPGLLGRFLIRVKFVQSYKTHLAHHTVPYEKGYCITTGWMNPFLDRIRFFRGLEWLVMRTTGALPRGDDVGERAALQILRDMGLKPPKKYREAYEDILRSESPKRRTA